MEAKAFHNESKGEMPHLIAITSKNICMYIISILTLTKMSSTVNTLLIIDAIQRAE